MIQLGTDESRQYELIRIISHGPNAYVLVIQNQTLSENLDSGRCESITNSTIPPSSPLISYQIISPSRTFVKCNSTVNNLGWKQWSDIECRDNYKLYDPLSSESSGPLPSDSIPSGCSIIQLPIKPYSPIVTAELELIVNVSEDCSQCHDGGGQCQLDHESKFKCAEKGGQQELADGPSVPPGSIPNSYQTNTKGKSKVLPIALGVGCPAIVIIIICLWRSYKKKNASTNSLARNTYAVQSSRSDLEGGSVYFGVHIFPYSELQEATNNFDNEKELGDGGFGTVYYGKLHDGREVAVKRLYEHNCRQVKQFINEVEILMRMRHKNRVSLYGCTSRRSRELLLVYEFISNGTVADHIHGDRATPGSLPWPTRMGIAIETASALAFLHASEIIHRDVKTNNILLDNNFCVKVADFGLSRLFPNDVTHVSTRPQGTPGYVDPEYRQCYQLTKKSDVYSFGVVLIELISSLPAVDITRHRHEVNLANLAVNKIEQRAFHELIDPHLGFQSDDEVKRMTISVASVAFQCIQGGQELRPSMVEVLEALKGIQSGKDAGPLNVHPPTPPGCDEVGLLKKTHELPPSPDAVTDKWTS